ncbi:hypothetical protein H4R19_005062, partial [Coemansia spiralis]
MTSSTRGESPSVERSKAVRRNSLGLGIVLTDESHDAEYPQDMLTAGMLASHAIGQTQTSDFGGSTPPARSSGTDYPGQQRGEVSLLARIMGGLTALVSTADDKDADQGQSKSRIEDMLESYYAGQGRDVPYWVHDPPPDPRVVVEKRPTSFNMDSVEESPSSSIDIGRESSAKPSTVSNTGVFRSFAKLNISRLARSQTPWSAHESSDTRSESQPSQASEPTPGASMGARLRRMLPPQLVGRSGNDSGFGSPAHRRRGSTSSTSSNLVSPPVHIRLVDSEVSSPYEKDTPSSFADYGQHLFALDSNQLSASANEGMADISPLQRPSPLYSPHYSPRLASSVRMALSGQVRASTSASPVPGTRTPPRIKAFASNVDSAQTPPRIKAFASTVDSAQTPARTSAIPRTSYTPGASGILHVGHSPGASGIPHTVHSPGQPAMAEYAAPAPRHKRRMSWVNPANWRPKSMRKQRSATNTGGTEVSQMRTAEQAAADAFADSYRDDELE